MDESNIASETIIGIGLVSFALSIFNFFIENYDTSLTLFLVSPVWLFFGYVATKLNPKFPVLIFLIPFLCVNILSIWTSVKVSNHINGNSQIEVTCGKVQNIRIVGRKIERKIFDLVGEKQI